MRPMTLHVELLLKDPLYLELQVHVTISGFWRLTAGTALKPSREISPLALLSSKQIVTFCGQVAGSRQTEPNAGRSKTTHD